MMEAMAESKLLGLLKSDREISGDVIHPEMQMKRGNR